MSFFHRSTTARYELRAYQEKFTPEIEPVSLIQDVDPRWNSTFDTYERFLRMKIPLMHVLAELSNTEFALKTLT